MLVASDFSQLPVHLKGCALTIGSFDGLHLGHQWLVKKIREHAQAMGCPAGLMTFEPHPAKVLAARQPLPLLMPVERKRRALQNAGLDFLIEQRFSEAFAAMSPEDFLAQVLGRSLQIRALVVGSDFTYGQGRQGGGRQLLDWGRFAGVAVEVVPRKTASDRPLSSSQIRADLQAGDVGAARRLLGRSACLVGRVTTGLARGRSMGFPTANLEPDGEVLVAAGVYLSRVAWENGDCVRLGLTNVGVSPTFGPGPMRVETYLLEFDGELVGREMAVTFEERLRAEKVFSTTQALVQQMRQDELQARNWQAPTGLSVFPHSLDGVSWSPVSVGP